MPSILKKLFPRTPFTRAIFFAVLDIVLVSCAFYLSFLLRFDGKIPQEYFPIMRKVIGLALAFCLPIFYFQRLYFVSWTYIGTIELLSLLKATTLAYIFLGIAIYISGDFPAFSGFPRSILFFSYVLSFLFCGALRMSKRAYFQIIKSDPFEKEKVLIVGAGDAGEQLLRSMLVSGKHYLPIGFVDDSNSKQGEVIHGLSVLGKVSDIPALVAQHQVREIIIAMPSTGSEVIRRAVEKSREAGVKKVKLIPSVNEIIDGIVSVKNIRGVQAEDLLRREEVLLKTDLIREMIRGKRILVTGAAGSIGSELCRQVAKFEPELLVLIDQDETGIFNIAGELTRTFPRLRIQSVVVDICSSAKIRRIFEEVRPEIVFHAAAYKHVPLMERQPEEAVTNNVFGTKVIAEAALGVEASRFVFISTDKAVNPSSVMGATKRIGEKICQAMNQKGKTKFMSVRFGNVLDSRGSVIPTFKEQIKKGGPVEVTHPEMQRYFMVTSEAVILVMQAAAIGKGGEVFVLDMGSPIKILDLAKDLIRLSGLEPDKDIPIVFTGVREGEKLFEEILTAEEGTDATESRKIFIAKLVSVSGSELEGLLEELKTANSNEEIIETLKKIVPTYNSR